MTAREKILQVTLDATKEALYLCMCELFSIYSQFGNRENAIKNSNGLKSGMQVMSDRFKESEDNYV